MGTKYKAGKSLADAQTVTMTADEDAARAAEIAADDAARPLQEWEGAMIESDEGVPRFIEDIYDALDEDAQGRVPQITRDRITAKKTLRGQKP